jgi:hypothetical protein
LALADIPVPNNLDGCILEKVLSEDLKNRIQRINVLEAGSSADKQYGELAADERSQLEDRLRNLGYLG